ncbi:unnamed protein product [Allacma fusca]|uniref:Uncharacterized protein n=1 Tax=Allacma fusca TaxID=39272 RepID=A0A8J2LHU8_9HEXA|nr:unnamed protein product [Allacma fusca]
MGEMRGTAVEEDVFRKRPENDILGEMNHVLFFHKLQEAIDANNIKQLSFQIFFETNLKGNFSNHNNKALLIVSIPTGCNGERIPEQMENKHLPDNFHGQLIHGLRKRMLYMNRRFHPKRPRKKQLDYTEAV